MINENIEKLKTEDMYAEFMFMGLRMTKGIEKQRFFERFNKSVFDVYGNEIKHLKELNLINETDTNIMLTEKGVDVSNTVFEKFII